MNILVAIDAPRGGGRTGTTTRCLTQAFGAVPVLCHAVSLKRLEYKDIPDFQFEMIKQQTRKTGEGILRDAEAALAQVGVAAETRLLFGEPGSVIREEYDGGDYQLCVVGSRGKPEIKELLFGSLSSDLVYHATKPVLVIKQGMLPQSPPLPLKVLVGVDNSGAARRALTFLERHAHPERFALTFLQVVDPDTLGLEGLAQEDQQITRAEARKESLAFLQVKAQRFVDRGFQVELEVAEGNAGQEIVEVYRGGGYEMLVAGRSGYKELGDFVHDSVCHYVARHHPVNILLVP